MKIQSEMIMLCYTDENLKEDIRLLREKPKLTFAESKKVKKRIMEYLKLDLEMLLAIAKDDKGFWKTDHSFDFVKYSLYLELAIEIYEKILIPKQLTMKEYLKQLS